ncbi:uncharacterized protein LOC113790749 [Dermatophagoides pteronyssinus]|uniref:Low-density lipoprotein receptor-related protein 8-like n=1 Tax=Dermatophagoides pteronyssinus TaxID=6956 RepID=A0A6P6XTS9_DERPT|nr:low-density lipoprotein receptor-related protein 8-like [Dermatophagoides pteronyssinus]
MSPLIIQHMKRRFQKTKPKTSISSNISSPLFFASSNYHSTILMAIIIQLLIICLNIANNYVDAFDYWRKLGPLSPDLKLGTECRNSLECLLFVPNSQCDCHICKCQPYHILYNQTMCLPASLLGYACSVDEQCTARVSNAQCTNGLCQCESNYLPLRRDKCLPPAMAGDFCLNEQQCLMGNRQSKCKYIIPRIYGKCRCLDGFYQTKDNRCLPNLQSSCNNSNECQQVTPNSYCANSLFSTNKCQCKPGFQESKDHQTCRPLPTTTTTTTTTEPPRQIITNDDLSPNFIDDSFNEEEISFEDEPQIRNANAVSLGKHCNHSFECQLRDPYSRCIDGICDCIKRSDECNALKPGCHADTFQCRNGQCVSWYFVCDKNNNCDDGSDENQCEPYNCPKETFQCKSDGICVPRQSVCNGKWECSDGSDEALCHKGNSCDSQAWQCKSGQCLPQYAFCNAVSDCLDGSDEDEEICESSMTCPNGTFTCSNRMCRSTAILCSGVDGCGDNSDEERCEVCYCQKP